MKRLIQLTTIMITLAVPAVLLSAPKLQTGDRFHITGCENGELMSGVVNLWSKPGGIVAGAKVVGKLSGDGRVDQGLKCQGSVVVTKEIQNVKGQEFIKVETIIGSQEGWITDSFSGKKFDKSKCAKFFAGDVDAIKKCSE